MTEPLLIATCLLAVALTAEWVAARRRRRHSRAAGWAIVAACMTRYEAWPICAALLALAWLALLRRGQPLGDEPDARAPARHLSRRRAGAVQRQQPLDDRHVVRAVGVLRARERGARQRRARVRAGARERLRRCRETPGCGRRMRASLLVVVPVARRRDRAPLLLVLALAGAAVLPWYAFYQGHPLRIRYGLPLVAACAALTAPASACCGAPLRLPAAAAVVVWALVQSSPFDCARADDRRIAARRRRTRSDAADGHQLPARALGRHHDHDEHGIARALHARPHRAAACTIRDFLQEGNEQLWVHAATRGPRGFVAGS